MTSPKGFTVAEAVERFVAGLAVVQPVDLRLAEAQDQVLAEPVLARRPVPDSPRSAVDGWAVQAADTDGASPDRPVRLRIIGSAFAGHPTQTSLGSGEAVRITTGGVLPAGADAAEYQEVCTVEDGALLLPRPVQAGANVRRDGEDMHPGQELLPGGTRLSPEAIGLLAALGEDRVRVRRPLKLRFVSTGDEIVRVGEERPSGGTYDSNSLQIGAHLRKLGANVDLRGPIPDTAEALAEACLGDDYDFLITSGGVSVGPADRISEVGSLLGAEVRFHWARMRPGAPTMGLRLHGRPWLGLSGNPLSAQVGFDLFGRAAVARLLGTGVPTLLAQARLVESFRGKPPDAPRYLRASLRVRGAELEALVHPYQSSGGVRAMAQTNGYVLQREGIGELIGGTLVDVLLVLSV